MTHPTPTHKGTAIMEDEKMTDLIARLESATEGSRELEREIAVVLNLPVPKGQPPKYTRSVDCALRLIPDGPWNGEISWNFGELRIGGWVELNKANPAWLKPDYDPSQPPHEHAACVDSYSDQEPASHKPRPLALAICIASLKAKDSTDGR